LSQSFLSLRNPKLGKPPRKRRRECAGVRVEAFAVTLKEELRKKLKCEPLFRSLESGFLLRGGDE
jgi:hypothetical protein